MLSGQPPKYGTKSKLPSRGRCNHNGPRFAVAPDQFFRNQPMDRAAHCRSGYIKPFRQDALSGNAIMNPKSTRFDAAA